MLTNDWFNSSKDYATLLWKVHFNYILTTFQIGTSTLIYTEGQVTDFYMMRKLGLNESR